MALQSGPLSLLSSTCKERCDGDHRKEESKGQLTVPKTGRDALGLGEGDDVIFRVEGNRAILARTPEFLSLVVECPGGEQNMRARTAVSSGSLSCQLRETSQRSPTDRGRVLAGRLPSAA
jgi:AbrB family looped-hinge helix DNA binding protein